MDTGVRLRLEDMLTYAKMAVSILGQVDASGLAGNDEKSLAVARAVEIVGEAANAIDPSHRQLLPGLPWVGMIGMRHRLVHGYGSIDLGVLVDTVRNHLPQLIAEIERILNTET